MEQPKKEKSIWQKMGLAVDDTSTNPSGNAEQPVQRPATTGFPKSNPAPNSGFPATKIAEKKFPEIKPIVMPSSFDEDEFATEEDKENDFTPTTSVATPTFAPTTPSENPHIEKTSEKYAQGFAEMNKEGLDFYDFYHNLVSSGNVDKTEVYQMAFNLLKSMNANLTKESMSADADEYCQKIEQAYQNMKQKGQGKQESLVGEKQQEQSQLSQEVDSLESQIRELTVLLNTKKRELSEIDGKYAQRLHENQLKLEAHDIVKNNLIGSIQRVIRNINQTIK